MWFNYRRTPLGTAVRDSMAAIVGMYRHRSEAEEDLRGLRNRLSAEIKVLDVEVAEDFERLVQLDPDSIDIVKSCGGRYVLVAFWSTVDP